MPRRQEPLPRAYPSLTSGEASQYAARADRFRCPRRQAERAPSHLVSHGVEVRGPVDHEGWSKSIYFNDPNGLQLEVCHLLRAFGPDDAVPRVRFRLEKGRKLEVASGTS